MKYLLVFVALAGIMMTGCKKTENPTPADPPKTLNDLQASANFNWTTGESVELQITGLPTLVPVKSTLTVSLAGGSVLFSSLHQMDQNKTITLFVPATENLLVLKYGNQRYEVPITDQKARFSFIPVIEEEI